MSWNTVLFRFVEAPAWNSTNQDPVCPALPPRILYGKDGCGTDIPLIWVGKQAIKKETGKWYKMMTGNSFGIVLKREWAYSLVNRKAGGANLLWLTNPDIAYSHLLIKPVGIICFELGYQPAIIRCHFT